MSEQENSIGYCPICGARGLKRERRMGGDDTCENGHKYPSHTALATSDCIDDDDAFTAESNDEVINIINKS